MTKFFADTPQRNSSKMATTRGEAPPSAQDEHLWHKHIVFKSQGVIEAKTGEDTADAVVAHAGPGAGEGAAVYGGADPNPQGFTTPYGSSVLVHGNPGQESIVLRHSSGAAVEMRPDGSVFLHAVGKKGFGISAGTGDGTVSSKGRLIIDADEIIFQSKGNIQFQAGDGAVSINAKDFNMKASGSANMEIDGRLVTDVGLDNNHTVGGHMRTTVAGNIRMQTPNELRTDSKSATMKTTESIEFDATKSMYIRAKDDTNITTSDGGITVGSKGRATFGSTEGEMQLLAKTSMNIDSANHMAMKATNIVTHVAGSVYTDITGDSELVVGGNIKMSATEDVTTTSGDVTTINAGTTLTTRSGGQTNMNAGTTMKMDVSGGIDMRGDTIDLNKGSPVVLPAAAPSDVERTTKRDAFDIDAPEPAEYPDSRAIIGSMITSADIPDFPYNAKKMSSNDYSVLQNEGNEPAQQAQQYTSQNIGGGSRSEYGGSVGELTTFPQDNTSVGEESPFPPPGGTEVPEALSRNVTSFPGYSKIPGSGQNGASRAEIINNIRHLSHNIIDPLIQQFGSGITLTSGFRLKDGKGGNSNHFIGKAIDLRSSNRNDYAATAAIAKWIVDHLPFDRVFLEKNDEGGIHVHAEAAPVGRQGRKTVWTCADPKCHSRVDGLHLDYAVRALKKSTRN